MKCDYCEKAAVCNFQREWTKYPITDDESGIYGEPVMCTELNDNDPPVDGDSVHVCKEHERAFIEGENMPVRYTRNDHD